jgi:hypothetical protein
MGASNGRRYIETDHPFHGRSLTALLDKADALHELMFIAGRPETFEVEAMYDLGAEEWTVQLHDCSRGIGCSLYHMN